MRRTDIIEGIRKLRGPVQVKEEACELLERDAEKLEVLRTNLKDARNELCVQCGKYPNSYQGACDGCRWSEDSEWML